MPRPPQQRAKGKGAVSSVVEAACQLRTSLHAADAANTLTDDNAALLPHLSNYLSSYNIFGHSMPTREQLTEITHGLLEADMPNTLLQCLKTIKPSSLIAPSGCSDPNCGDGQCGPPSATPFILATMTQTMTVVAQEGTTAADDFLSALVSAGLASNLFELIDAASTAVRVGPRDPMGIIGADHGLATVLDSLQFLTNWIQYHSQDEFEEGNTHYCITLLTEMEDLGFLPRAIALHETLTKTIVLFRGAIELRSSGTDASICQLVGLYALAGNNFPETGIDALSSSTYSDCISRTIVRCSLKLGAKVPQAALGTILSDSTPSSAPAPLLQPHWASAEQCTSILLQAIMAAQTLVRSFTEDPFDDEDEDEKAQQDAMLARSTSVRRLASLETALTLVAVLKNLVAARQDPDKRKGDACAGCALTMLSLQSGSLLSQIVLLLPREVTIQGGLADDVTSLLVILQLKAMGRAVNLRLAKPVAVEECENGEVDWSLVDLMLAIHLHLAGGSPALLEGRLQRTHHVSTMSVSKGSAGHQSLLSHHKDLHDASAYSDANGTNLIYDGLRESALNVTKPSPWLPASSSLRLFRCVEGLLRVPASPLNSPEPHQPLVRVGHLTALDLATALVARSPDSLFGHGRDFVSLCATIKKLTSSVVPSEKGGEKRALSPDFACELIIREALILQTTLDIAQFVGPLPSHLDSISSGSFHILCSLQTLISYLSLCLSECGVAAPTLFCPEAASEALAVVLRICVSLLKAPLPTSLVLLSDIQSEASSLLTDIIKACGTSEAYCTRTKGSNEAPPSLQRAIVWSGALALIEILMLDDAGSSSRPDSETMRTAAAQSIAPLVAAVGNGRGSEMNLLCAVSLAGAIHLERTVSWSLSSQLESALTRAKAGGLIDSSKGEEVHQYPTIDQWAAKAVTSSSDDDSLSKLLAAARLSYLSSSYQKYHEEFVRHPAILTMPRSRLPDEDLSLPERTRMERIQSNLGEGGLLKLSHILQSASSAALASSQPPVGPQEMFLRLLCEEGMGDGVFGSTLLFALRQLVAKEGGEPAGLELIELLARVAQVQGDEKETAAGGGEGGAARCLERRSQFYVDQASKGLFVGCCNSECLNLDKMSEAQLTLAASDGRAGMFCTECLR